MMMELTKKFGVVGRLALSDSGLWHQVLVFVHPDIYKLYHLPSLPHTLPPLPQTTFAAHILYTLHMKF